MATLFISDLHLSAERPAITALFLSFLKERARGSDALYILGDLFEYWIGDDACAEAEYGPIVEGLRALTESGVPVHVMHGNRDFLLGEEFARQTGSRLLADPTVVDLHGIPTLLMHGDSLCTDDVEYQRFRAYVRSPAMIQAFLAKPLLERDAIVRGYREMSKTATSSKMAEIMDVNAGAVDTALRNHGVPRLIHGHTHRPATHDLSVDGKRAQRIVLGDWYEQGSVLRCDARTCVLENLVLAN
jgi:UDP-2,3-diacylglucosamine hydrolase